MDFFYLAREDFVRCEALGRVGGEGRPEPDKEDQGPVLVVDLASGFFLTWKAVIVTGEVDVGGRGRGDAEMDGCAIALSSWCYCCCSVHDGVVAHVDRSGTQCRGGGELRGVQGAGKEAVGQRAALEAGQGAVAAHAVTEAAVAA